MSGGPQKSSEVGVTPRLNMRSVTTKEREKFRVVSISQAFRETQTY